MHRLFRQFSSPGGIPSHVSVPTPGSIHEGGELGYVLVHAFGAVMDNPDLIALAVVGDGEAETGPLEGSWKGISFLNPARDGAVLPILHLNGAKIAGPTVLARKDPAEVRSLLEGHGYDVIEVTGDDLPGMHYRFAEALARAWAGIRGIQAAARGGDWDGARPRWPLIVLRTPKGWTGPSVVDGVQVEGTWRAHQVPLAGIKGNDEHLRHPRGRGCGPTGPRSCSTTMDGPPSLVRRANPEGARPDERVAARERGAADRRPGPAGLPRVCAGRPEAGVRARRVDAPARRADARHLSCAIPRPSGCSAPTRPTATGWVPSSRCPTARSPSGSPTTTWLSRATGGSWRCCRSTTVTAGWRATP